MKNIRRFVPLFVALGVAFPLLAGPAEDAEKQKALADPYANDSGPSSLEGFGWVSLKDYPADVQAGYRLLLDKCAKCHTAARPLNSQFVEPVGAKEQKPALVSKILSEPGVSADPLIWNVEDGIWQRYVRRMMAKPGCAIAAEEGKQIWAFLCFDSVHRKTGKNAVAWKAHREKLLSDFKAKHPERYKALYSIAP